MARTAPTRWAPHWETIDGVVYMTETGGTFHVDRQQVGHESDTAGDAYTLIFSRDEEDNDVLHGVIKGDVDLTVADFKNARSVSEVDAITIEPWLEDASDIFSHIEPVGDVDIM